MVGPHLRHNTSAAMAKPLPRLCCVACSPEQAPNTRRRGRGPLWGSETDPHDDVVVVVRNCRIL